MAASTTTTSVRWLITGANRGIGLRMTKILAAADGNQVVAACRSASDDLKAISGVHSIIENIDVASSDVGKTLVGALAGQAPFDVVINNAGILKNLTENILEVPDDGMMQQFDVNSVGPIRVTQALLNAGLVASGGKLIFVSSVLGSITERRDGALYAYAMSKAALNMAVVTLSNELPTLGKKGLVPEGILASAVHPGWVATDMGTTDFGVETAPVRPEDAAASIIKHAQELTAEGSGHFVDMTTGKDLPW